MERDELPPCCKILLKHPGNKRPLGPQPSNTRKNFDFDIGVEEVSSTGGTAGHFIACMWFERRSSQSLNQGAAKGAEPSLPPEGLQGAALRAHNTLFSSTTHPCRREGIPLKMRGSRHSSQTKTLSALSPCYLSLFRTRGIRLNPLPEHWAKKNNSSTLLEYKANCEI